MSFEEKIRSFARQLLPPFVRRPVGRFCGWLRSRLVYPAMGLLFDLTGGCFHADGCSFVIPKNITSREFRACFLLKTYENDERMLVQKYILPEDRVLEAGACMGIIACITNKCLRQPTQHVVVEANPYCIPAIHRNRHRNQAAFLVENCAISNDPEVTFFVNPAYVTGSSLRNNDQSNVAVRLPGRSLPELNARYGPFSVLIMDIEGSELEALQASVEILGRFRLVILELHEAVIGVPGVNACRALLTQAGFKMVEASYITEVWLKT